MRTVSLTKSWFAGLLVVILAMAPAVSVQMAGWSERLEPLPWIAALGAIVGIILARSRIRALFGMLEAALIGLVACTLLYALTLPQADIGDRLQIFIKRVADWLGNAFSGVASTDNLLFAYSMALLAWSIGWLGGWFVFRRFNPWWAIVFSGSALLLNLSYSPPDLLPLVFVHLLASFGLLITVNSIARVTRWENEEVEYGMHQGTGFAMTSAAVALAILFLAWNLPAGQVNRAVASSWEQVSGPWQNVQTTFDRLFASLNPSPVSGGALAITQTMAPRGSFELGNKPVMRVQGREPAYWRAATYDRYTGRVMTMTQATSVRLDRQQPIDPNRQFDDGRKFLEYSFTLLAPSSGILYSPDVPVNVSVPSVYDYRADMKDYAILRPVATLREEQKYSVFASVSSASNAELRQAGSVYPSWTRNYLQLPPTLPEAVKNETWRVVGDANNVYDAANRIEAHLRTLKYSTHVPVPPADRDWVSFLLFESKEGYCDYYATAMTVMLRSIGIPSRVVNGYVTGDYDAATQSYLVTERHAHTWTEVYFPKYGWVTFEPSANRPEPARLENPLIPLNLDDLPDFGNEGLEDPEFLDDEEDFTAGGVVVLPPAQTGPAMPPFAIAFGIFAVVLALGGVVLAFLWMRGMAGLPLIARTYAQVVRLASWGGMGPRRGQTPYEYSSDLGKSVPSVAAPLRSVADAYVATTYGGKKFDADVVSSVRSAGAEIRRVLVRALVAGRWQGGLSRRLREFVGTDRHR
jgi:transglutaminase-like putative cysteine protease